MPKLIDVKELIARLSGAEILESADKYFAGMTEASDQCFKPFSNPADSVHLLRNFALLLQAAEVYAGADVLDFGCGTGWVTLALSDMGVRATGVDISPTAIRLAESVKKRRDLRHGHWAHFETYNGSTLPFSDERFDRIVCFDAFHHVADQESALREFSRVLRPGGRVAMLEPGPRHSLSPQSQAEMAQYNVIENDVCLHEISGYALQAGLDSPRVIVQFPAAFDVDLAAFHRLSGPQAFLERDSISILDKLRAGLTDTQCFYFTKGAEIYDSRRASRLGGRISLLECSRVEVGRPIFRFLLELRNVGTGVWLGRVSHAGQVNLGVQLLGREKNVLMLDFQRVPLPVQQVLPGEKVLVDFDVDLSSVGSDFSELRFDLVAEQVAWFGSNGANYPVDWRPEGVSREA